jgi:hypothetical protein
MQNAMVATTTYIEKKVTGVEGKNGRVQQSVADVQKIQKTSTGMTSVGI